MKALFIVLCGLPGSGKSTARIMLQEMLGSDATTISSDDFIESVAAAQSKTYDQVFMDTIDAATIYANTTKMAALGAGRSIIMDRTHLDLKARRRALGNVSRRHYQRIAVFFETSELDRQNRLSARQGKTIPPIAEGEMMMRYLRPTQEEGFDLVLPGNDLGALRAAIEKLVPMHAQ